ncbi:hypothetical protein [Sutcliffiella horikoshii]|nr:hypothetical protein [Sutcliffiella horikoshii]
MRQSGEKRVLLLVLKQVFNLTLYNISLMMIDCQEFVSNETTF